MKYPPVSLLYNYFHNELKLSTNSKTNLLRVINHLNVLFAKLLTKQLVKPLSDLCQGRHHGFFVDVLLFILIFEVCLQDAWTETLLDIFTNIHFTVLVKGKGS